MVNQFPQMIIIFLTLATVASTASNVNRPANLSSPSTRDMNVIGMYNESDRNTLFLNE